MSKWYQDAIRVVETVVHSRQTVTIECNVIQRTGDVYNRHNNFPGVKPFWIIEQITSFSGTHTIGDLAVSHIVLTSLDVTVAPPQSRRLVPTLTSGAAVLLDDSS